jgi:hypothetical protein
MLSGLVLGWGVAIGAAQEASPPDKTKAEDRTEKKLAEAYRLEFSVDEIEGGKKLNTRQYSMNLNAGDANEVNIGTRVAVETQPGKFDYLNVGTTIWCRLRHAGGDALSLEVRAEITNFANPEQVGKAQPVIRSFKIGASTMTVAGKPAVVGSVDDPNSKRRYQLEVTATRLR